MKRTRSPRRARLSADAEQLVRLAAGLAESGSRLEDVYWDSRLAALIDPLLAAHDEDALNAALDQLYHANPQAFNVLADTIETRCESYLTGKKDEGGATLLIVAPVLAWSRFSIPSGVLPKEVLANLRTHLQAHVLAQNAKLALADFLFSQDQLPTDYSSSAALAGRLAMSARSGRDLHLDPKQLPQTIQFLSDMRYVLGSVSVPRGAALFRWQETEETRVDSREQSAKQWRIQAGAALQTTLQGCAFELLPPQAYYSGCRDADRQARPYSLRAAVTFLQTTLNVSAAALRAVIAPFHEQRLEEFRIGLILKEGGEMVHGVVWPLLDAEDESSDIAPQIEAVLRESGILDIVMLGQRFPLEYCDDCGAPLYPNPEGEPVHAELPEQSEAASRHLH